MIKRLIKLEVDGFRIFTDRQTIPLDADVVLIYGPNASGKSSLLHALEYAIAGEVADLKTFADDYPRSLRHTPPIGRTTVSLQFSDMSNQIIPLYRSVTDDTSRLDLNKLEITDSDRQFFLERCYLSQARLGRLLQPDQASEHFLVRFAREFVGLNFIENLLSGLHKIINRARLDNESEQFLKLVEAEKILPKQEEELDRQETFLTKQRDESLLVVQNLFSKYGDPVDGLPLTADGLKKRIETLESAHYFDRLQELLSWKSRLEIEKGSLKILNSQAKSGTIDILQGLLVSIEERQNEIKQKFTLILKKIYEKNLIGFQEQPTVDIDQQLYKIDLTIAEKIAHFEAEILARTETEAKLKSLEQQVTKRETVIKEFDTSPSEMVETQRRWVELLRGVSEYIQEDVCPVCGRDYLELHKGNLKSHILQELDKLGIDIQRLESKTRRRIQLETEQSEDLRQIDVIRDRNQYKLPLDQIRESQQILMQLVEELSKLKADRNEWEQLRSERSKIISEIEAIKSQQIRRTQIIQNLSDLFNEIGHIFNEGDPEEPELRAEIVEKSLQVQVDKVQNQLVVQSSILEALRPGYKAAAELNDLQRLKHFSNALRASLKIARGKVDDYQQKARNLVKAATNAKKKIIDKVFNENLNSLWADLFNRLVKNDEKFKPRVGELISERNKIRVPIQAIAEGTLPFEHIASILSAGNLNTAALSLFLSLHLIVEPKHRLLVLDDPVQSMDDIHVVNLASLLRAIAYQEKRQIVVAVHERALFDYLCLELGPTRNGDSLIAIELVRNENGHETYIKHEKRLWKPDQVRFET
jgi:exonuclease SbcC